MKYLLSLGSNMGQRGENLSTARNELTRCFGETLKVSSVYETPPWGFKAEQSFYNQVICLESKVNPTAFLESILSIETSLGRKRAEESGYASRIIDIDILLIDNLVINKEVLTVPHPEMHKRRFVLVPAVEIVPEWKHPVLGRTMTELLAHCPDDSKITLV